MTRDLTGKNRGHRMNVHVGMIGHRSVMLLTRICRAASIGNQTTIMIGIRGQEHVHAGNKYRVDI